MSLFLFYNAIVSDEYLSVFRAKQRIRHSAQQQYQYVAVAIFITFISINIWQSWQQGIVNVQLSNYQTTEEQASQSVLLILLILIK